MKTKIHHLNACFILLFIFWMSVVSAHAFRCGNRIVSVGDSKFEVLMKCGEPLYKDNRSEEHTDIYKKKNRRGFHSYKETVNIEEWVYNFGPNMFIQFLRFENGKLTSIDDGSYGFTETVPLEKIEKSGCKPLPSVGDRKMDVLLKCGKPTSEEYRTAERECFDGFNKHHMETRSVSVTIDEWLYNFGPNQFMYTFVFENGKVVSVQQGRYGF